jgi:hypothetical protein
MRALLLLAVAMACGTAGAARAQEGGDADALAKALSNPVAALISVPMQLNYDSGYGAGGDGERWTLNVQPVIPVGISSEWNLISRTILPIVDQSDVIGNDSQSGLGDVLQSVFFSPKTPTATGWIWGVGPALLLPTATDELLGAEQWAIGPTAVALKQTATGWTYGALVNHLLSVAGSDDRSDVNASFLQPFVSKSLGSGRTASINLESAYDWESQQWNVPLNVSYSKVTRLGAQLMSWQVGARGYIEKPDGGPDWGVRFVLTVLYPK